MLGTMHDALDAWIESVASDLTLSRAAPGTEQADIVTYALALSPRANPTDAGPRSRRRAKLAVRFLVTTNSERGRERLGDVAAAALLDDALDVELDASDPTLWLALGAPPRPAFFVDVEHVGERHVDRAPFVRQPLLVDLATPRNIEGLVIAGNGTPLAGARIELVGLDRSTHADSHGRFELPMVPADGVPTARVRVTARERELMAVADLGAPGPVVIRCDIEEE